MAAPHLHRRRSTGLVVPGRRGFLRDLGRGTFALAITGTVLTACGDDDAASPSSDDEASAPSTMDGSDAGEQSGPTDDPAALRWERVSLDFVSAYVVARGSEAAVVDTGVEGSEEAIAAGLAALGLDLSAVGDIILTHSHQDHRGSAAAVMAASGATVHAGFGDLDAIEVDAVGVGDGDEVFGMQIVDTPGHTPGHIAVFDQATRLLLAGDALIGTDDGGVQGPNPRFSDDHDLALAQIATLAALEPEQVVFGHGEPVLASAALEIRALL